MVDVYGRLEAPSLLAHSSTIGVTAVHAEATVLNISLEDSFIVNVNAQPSIAFTGKSVQIGGSSGGVRCTGAGCQIVLDAADAVGLSGSSSVVGSVISVAASDLALHGSSYLSTDGLGSAGSAHTRSTAACNSSARMPMMPSDACECSLAAASLGLEYADVADVEWPQGCIVRADSAYFAAGSQTGSSEPSASDGGGAFICRTPVDDSRVRQGGDANSCIDSGNGGGGGGGHGGDGGDGESNAAPAGIGYGDELWPSDSGSGGGRGYYKYGTSGGYSAGGGGGGVINVTLSGALNVSSGAA